MKKPRFLLSAVLCLLLIAVRGAKAQPEQRIAANCAPYRIEWNGTTGTFTRRSMGQEPTLRMPLIYLHTDPGPKGHARYLAWFLAREEKGFALLWCYLNETGTEFWCWLYRYPENLLTTHRFVGDYRYTPAADPLPSSPANVFQLPAAPTYQGPDFAFRDWTRRAGTLETLALRPAAYQTAKTGATAQSAALPAPTRTLTKLRVQPLHELRVGSENGWRNSGWSELHTLAYDDRNDPYYLILYSNSANGFVVDLKRGQNYTADFGGRVRFAQPDSVFGGRGRETEPSLEMSVRRFERHEITLLSNTKYANPYTDVALEAEVNTPEGQKWTVPGFWDGTNVWRIRIAPTIAGTWTWRVRSKDPELNGSEGSFECVEEAGQNTKGFLRVNPLKSNSRHFTTTNNTPFYPVSGFVGRPLYDKAQISEMSAFGINRLTGGYLLDNAVPPGTPTPFLKGDPDQVNLEFYRLLDKNFARCNVMDIVPDIGIGWLSQDVLTKYTDTQLRRMWRYVLARYGSFNVCWNLFGGSGTAISSPLGFRIAGYAEFTRLYDPYRHPLTTMTSDTMDSKVAGQPFDRARWVDFLFHACSAPGHLILEADQKKPLMALDMSDPAVRRDKDAERKAVWIARMSGTYPVTALPGGKAFRAADSLGAQGYCAQFFRQTRFWRLEPHPEMLGRPEDNNRASRRRKRAEAEARKRANLNPEAAPPPMPIYVLADPSWEYAVYFTGGGDITLDLVEAVGRLRCAWFNPRTGKFENERVILGGDYVSFAAPDTQDWVLYISRR